jgi:hypothetical protein
MKVMRILALVLVVTGILALGAQEAQAEWLTCTVVQVGCGYNNTFLNLTDAGSAFSGRWFLADPTSYKEILATALTAVTAGKTVLVNVSALEEYSIIVAIYMNQ